MADLRGGTAKLDVVIGVDFGTSSTKVVVQVPRYTGSPAFAVPFGDLAHQSLKYLLPTRLYVGEDGRCSLTSIPEASVLTDMKIGLMENPPSKIEPVSGPPCDASATVVTAAYLALVLQYVRNWFTVHKSEIFRNVSLNWSWNLGIPAAVDDDSTLKDTFDIVGKAAWVASAQSEVTIETAEKAVYDIKNEKIKSEDMLDLTLIPEVIAEVTGYARSQLRNQGLHILIDIGASTLDVCSFILTDKDGDDHYGILTADVKLLGAKRLHMARIDGVNSAAVAQAATLIDDEDPGSIVPNDISGYVPSDKEINAAISDAEKEFKTDCERLLALTLGYLSIHRDPRSGRWDKENFPVFVCGGATAMQMYKEISNYVGEWLKKHKPTSPGARQINLPKPESLEADIDDESYHRLAVAWGLSHESFNIGTYNRPSEIEDFTLPTVKVDISDRYVSKDQV